MMRNLEKELKRFSKELAKAKQKGNITGFALIGALAVSARARPRATQDIDFLVSAKQDFFNKTFPHILTSLGCSFKIFKSDLHDPINGLIRIYDQAGNEMVDIIPVFWKWQDEIVASAPQLKISSDITIPVALAEDLVVLKLKAGGPQDILDIKELLKSLQLGPGIDKDRLFNFAKRAGVENDLKNIFSDLNLHQ